MALLQYVLHLAVASGVATKVEIRQFGALPSLQILILERNQIGDAGLKEFAAALMSCSGALPALKKIVVPSGLEQHPQLVAACQPRGIEIE